MAKGEHPRSRKLNRWSPNSVRIQSDKNPPAVPAGSSPYHLSCLECPVIRYRLRFLIK